MHIVLIAAFMLLAAAPALAGGQTPTQIPQQSINPTQIPPPPLPGSMAAPAGQLDPAMPAVPPNIINDQMTPEEAFLRGSIAYCLAPLLNDTPIPVHAKQNKLLELSSREAVEIGIPGNRAFGFPLYPKNQLVVAQPQGCSAIMRAISFGQFMATATAFFDSTPSFRLVEEQTAPDGSIRRIYVSELPGPVILGFSAHKELPGKGPQAILTFTRK